MTFKRHPSFIIEDAYDEFFDSLSTAIYNKDITKRELDKYLDKYHGDIYDEWIEWYKKGQI